MNTQTKKRSPIFYIALAVAGVIGFCILCLVSTSIMDAMGILPTAAPTLSAPTTQPQTTQPTSTPASTESPAAKYLQEYGGSEQAYLEILTSTDCAFLQQKFETAYANNQRETPGTEAFRWTLGYMTAIDDHMRQINCY